jgi:hypothetical protein
MASPERSGYPLVTKTVLAESEHTLLVEKCRALPPAKGDYLVRDYVRNMILTVLDYQMQTKAVERADAYFAANHSPTITTHRQLKETLQRYPGTKEGNIAAAMFLWNYRLWTRAQQLRGLLGYFEARGVTTQTALEVWAKESEFKRDFEGRVPGLGLAVYQWLVMRQGIETVKPDVHVRRFAEEALARRLGDGEIVAAFEAVAEELSLKAYELDWRIWEHQRTKV